MVILGAGASHDAVHPENLRTDWQPPTTDELFGPRFRDILQAIPAAQGPAEHILTAVRRAVGSGLKAGLLEEELVRLRDLAPVDRTKFHDVEAVRFYIQEVMDRCSHSWLDQQAGVTNQAWLVGEVEEWRAIERRKRTVYVTFNYDTILDQALAGRFSWNPRQSPGLDGYLRDERFALLKLHGSYDWGQLTGLNTSSSDWQEWRWDLIRLAGGYELRDEYRLLSAANAPVRDRLTTNIGDLAARSPEGINCLWSPALALPMSDKTQFVCPQAHQDLLDEVVPRTTAVLAVGWRAAESHFLARLVNLPAGLPFWVVNPHSADAAIERLRGAGIRASFKSISSGFSQFRDSIALHGFLISSLSEIPRAS
jgi:hypothetical protein